MYSEDPCSGSRQYDIQTWGQKSVRCAHGSWTKNQKLLTPLQIPWNNLSSMEGITFQVSSSSHILGCLLLKLEQEHSAESAGLGEVPVSNCEGPDIPTTKGRWQSMPVSYMDAGRSCLLTTATCRASVFSNWPHFPQVTQGEPEGTCTCSGLHHRKGSLSTGKPGTSVLCPRGTMSNVLRLSVTWISLKIKSKGS